MNDIKMCKSMQIGLLQRINNVEQADKHQKVVIKQANKNDYHRYKSRKSRK